MTREASPWPRPSLRCARAGRHRRPSAPRSVGSRAGRRVRRDSPAPSSSRSQTRVDRRVRHRRVPRGPPAPSVRALRARARTGPRRPLPPRLRHSGRRGPGGRRDAALDRPTRCRVTATPGVVAGSRPGRRGLGDQPDRRPPGAAAGPRRAQLRPLSGARRLGAGDRPARAWSSPASTAASTCPTPTSPAAGAAARTAGSTPTASTPTRPIDLTGHGTGHAGRGGRRRRRRDTPSGWLPGPPGSRPGSSTTPGPRPPRAVHQAFQWVLDPDHDPATADAPAGRQRVLVARRRPRLRPDLPARRPGAARGRDPPGVRGRQLRPGRRLSSVSPANYPESLSVGAVGGTGLDLLGRAAAGPVACGGRARVFPDVVAPGVDVLDRRPLRALPGRLRHLGRRARTPPACSPCSSAPRPG